MTDDLPFTYVDLREYQPVVTDNDPTNDKALASLYKLLSPTHLLKLPAAADSNRLTPRFYAELLHLIGLEETKESGKKLIRRKDPARRDEGSLLENTIVQLDTAGKIHRLPDRLRYGGSTDEQL